MCTVLGSCTRSSCLAVGIPTTMYIHDLRLAQWKIKRSVCCFFISALALGQKTICEIDATQVTNKHGSSQAIRNVKQA